MPIENKLGLTFSLDDHEKFVNHWMLKDYDVAEAIGKTADFLAHGSKNLTARVTVNGVELPFTSLERMFGEWYEHLCKKAEAKYSDVEAEVQRRLEERLKAEAKPILEKFWELQRVLEDPSQLLVPHWERKNNDG